MGTPKAQLVIGDSTLLRRVVDAVSAVGISTCLVVGGQAEWLSPNSSATPQWIPDEFPGEGPLGGLVTALAYITTPWFLLLSCDLVSVNPTALSVMINHIDSSTDAIVPVGHRWEVLHALYRTEAVRPICARFAEGARRVQSVLDGIRVREVPFADDDLLARSTLDVDTPEQFREVADRE